LGGFRLGKVLEKHRFNNVSGCFFELTEGLTNANAIFFGEAKTLVRLVSNHLTEARCVLCATDWGIETDGSAVATGKTDFMPLCEGDFEQIRDVLLARSVTLALGEFLNQSATLTIKFHPAPWQAYYMATIAQIVLNFAPDVGHGKGAKRMATTWLEAFDGADEANRSDLGKIFVGFAALATDLMGNLMDESHVFAD